MNDILTSKPSPSHPSTTTPSPLHIARLPPNGRGRGGVRGQQRRRVASGGQRKVAFSDSAGLMKRSQSDSRLYHEKEAVLSSDEIFGSISDLHGTYVKTPGSSFPDQQGECLMITQKPLLSACTMNVCVCVCVCVCV